MNSETPATVTKVGAAYIADIPENVNMIKIQDDGMENAPANMTFKCQKVR